MLKERGWETARTDWFPAIPCRLPSGAVLRASWKTGCNWWVCDSTIPFLAHLNFWLPWHTVARTWAQRKMLLSSSEIFPISKWHSCILSNAHFWNTLGIIFFIVLKTLASIAENYSLKWVLGIFLAAFSSLCPSPWFSEVASYILHHVQHLTAPITSHRLLLIY